MDDRNGDELAKLRRALDSAIYCLENIRACADAGTTPEALADIAEDGLINITAHFRPRNGNVVRPHFGRSKQRSSILK